MRGITDLHFVQPKKVVPRPHPNPFARRGACIHATRANPGRGGPNTLGDRKRRVPHWRQGRSSPAGNFPANPKSTVETTLLRPASPLNPGRVKIPFPRATGQELPARHSPSRRTTLATPIASTRPIRVPFAHRTPEVHWNDATPKSLGAVPTQLPPYLQPHTPT